MDAGRLLLVVSAALPLRSGLMANEAGSFLPRGCVARVRWSAGPHGPAFGSTIVAGLPCGATDLEAP